MQNDEETETQKARQINVDDLKPIACVRNLDRITMIHIGNILKPLNIDYVFLGSVIYGLSVTTSRANEALEILRKDVKIFHYYLWISKDEIYPASPLKTMARNISFKSLKNHLYIANSPSIQRFLQQKDIVKLGRDYPYVHSLNLNQRDYLATPASLQKGYEIEINLWKSPHSDRISCQYRYQIYDNGKQFREWGGWSKG